MILGCGQRISRRDEAFSRILLNGCGVSTAMRQTPRNHQQHNGDKSFLVFLMETRMYGMDDNAWKDGYYGYVLGFDFCFVLFILFTYFPLFSFPFFCGNASPDQVCDFWSCCLFFLLRKHFQRRSGPVKMDMCWQANTIYKIFFFLLVFSTMIKFFYKKKKGKEYMKMMGRFGKIAHALEKKKKRKKNI